MQEKKRKGGNVIKIRSPFSQKIKIRFTFPLLNGPSLLKFKIDFRDKLGNSLQSSSVYVSFACEVLG